MKQFNTEDFINETRTTRQIVNEKKKEKQQCDTVAVKRKESQRLLFSWLSSLLPIICRPHLRVRRFGCYQVCILHLAVCAWADNAVRTGCVVQPGVAGKSCRCANAIGKDANSRTTSDKSDVNPAPNSAGGNGRGRRNVRGSRR